MKADGPDVHLNGAVSSFRVARSLGRPPFRPSIEPAMDLVNSGLPASCMFMRARAYTYRMYLGAQSGPAVCPAVHAAGYPAAQTLDGAAP